MTKKIVYSILIVAIAVLLASFTIIVSSLYQYFASVQKEQLESQLNFAMQGVENEGVAYLQSLKEQQYRLTLISADGEVLYDSESGSDEMENHSDREEIREAMEYGVGESSRFSKTLTERTLYLAKRLPDSGVLRISVSHMSVITLILGMLQPMIMVLFVAVLLAIFLAVRLSKRIIRPLNNLSFERPLDNDVYEELSPILRHIDHQNKQIQQQIEEFRNKQEEFSAITRHMSEGLVLLDERGMILSMNLAAMNLFAVDGKCRGKDFLTIDRDAELARTISSSDIHSEKEYCTCKDGRDYQFRITKIANGEKCLGTVILIIDITEKMQAEQTRREFSANVSHELKTPLQSIMGSAELIENGLVKEEDLPRFAGHIRTEAARLVELINDIIRLSQLDEKPSLPYETVDVYALAEEISDELQPLGEKRNVSIKTDGDSVQIDTVRRLLYEIIYNLCDNAIRYNREGGSVQIHVGATPSGIEIAVSDTGIGIPPEDQSRIFERFYRVDKSHSKDTGGTGLGLSIVKHAVRYLGGEIRLESKVMQGTKITVLLPNTPA